MSRQSVLLHRAPLALFTLFTATVVAAQMTSTPRTADGRPDLSGYWSTGGLNFGNPAPDQDGVIVMNLPARDNDIGNFEKDFAVLERADPNKPMYRPEFWDVIQDNDWNGLTRDPVFRCMPAGVPRMGPPHKIVQTPAEVIFLYETRFNGQAMYRVIPTDGREHHRLQIADTTWLGYSLGHWDGDTLVVETIGFNDQSWLAWMGYIHTWDMKVTERIHREGDTLHWVATVEDPMLLEPWTMDPVARVRNTDPEAFFWGAVPCEERDAEHIVDPNVRG